MSVKFLMNNLPPISVAICTYNRADELALCLASIVNVGDSLHKDDEIIIVDNNSSDNTNQVVKEWSKKLPLKYIFEPVQGLSVARNTALKAYSKSVIFFVDDDVSITRGSLDAYRKAIHDFPDTGFFGGKILVDWQGHKPKWLHSEAMALISGLICHYDRDIEEQEYDTSSLLPYGANFMLTRKLTDLNGSFDSSLGVNGKEIGRGEETEYLMRALNQGFSGRYVSEALVYHRFDVKRLSTVYLFKYGIQKGRASSVVDGSVRTRNYLSALKCFLRACNQLFQGRVDRYYQSIINVGIEIGRGRSRIK